MGQFSRNVRAMKKLALLVPLLLAAAGCPKPRTSAATQPTPAAFDPAQSDAAAIAVVDTGLAALGGIEKWEKLQELKFTITYKQGGKLLGELNHSWDRWNGRHRLETLDIASTGGDPDDVAYMDVRYDLFDKGATPSGSYGGGPLLRADAAKQAAAAREHLAQDLYFIAAVYKLKDPGVKLSVSEPKLVIAGSEACKPDCTSIKVTFDPAVGTDTWFVNFNNETKLPEVLELQKGAGRVGYHMTKWIDAGGLKWPGQLQNIGLPDEIIEISDVKVGEPDDATYIPTVTGG